MKRSHQHLEIVVCTQADYAISTGKAYVPGAERIIVPGIHRLLALKPESCYGVLFMNNHFTADEYPKSDLAREYPPHCLRPDLGDYEEPGVQNVFSQRLLVTRGLSVFHLHKKRVSMWEKDMWDNLPSVHTMRGGASTAFSLPEFMGRLDEHGVSNIHIWGLGTAHSMSATIDGFLQRNFLCTVHLDKCRALVHGQSSEDILSARFSSALAADQLRFVPAPKRE